MLIEDHAVLRQGLRSLLEHTCGAQVVCDVGSAEEGLERFGEADPDLVILDLTLPGRDGIWAIRNIKKLRPGTKVVVLSMHQEEDIVGRALRAGADAYVVKSAAYSDIAEALAEVRAGRRYLHPDLDGSGRLHREAPETELPRLSQLEREVLKFLGQGLEEDEIGEALGMPPRAAARVVRALLERLGVAEVADLRHVGLRLDPEA